MKMVCRKEYYDTGELLNETYHKEGNNNCWHREDGPAFIRYYRSGQKAYESYYQNDRFHRVDGPAKIWYSENGDITGTEWWINGKRINPTNLMKILWKNKTKKSLTFVEKFDILESKEVTCLKKKREK